MKKNNHQTLSHETIYTMICRDKKQKKLHNTLIIVYIKQKRQGASKISRGEIIGLVDFEKPPKRSSENRIIWPF